MNKIEFDKSKLVLKEYSFQSLTDKITNRILFKRLKFMDITIDSVEYAGTTFKLTENDNNLLLTYTIHPSKWKVNDIIIELEREEHDNFINNGIGIYHRNL